MLNKIIQWSLKNRLFVIVAAVALLIYGGIVTLRALTELRSHGRIG